MALRQQYKTETACTNGANRCSTWRDSTEGRWQQCPKEGAWVPKAFEMVPPKPFVPKTQSYQVAVSDMTVGQDCESKREATLKAIAIQKHFYGRKFKPSVGKIVTSIAGCTDDSFQQAKTTKPTRHLLGMMRPMDAVEPNSQDVACSTFPRSTNRVRLGIVDRPF